MANTNRKNEPEIEDVDLDEIPPIGVPVIGIVLIWTTFAVGFGDLMMSAVMTGAGVLLIAGFGFKSYRLYQDGGPKKAFNYALTAPKDRKQDYSVDILQPSDGIEKTEQGITLDHLREIDPYEFEEFVAKVWDGMGYETEVTQGAQDRGIDVVAEKAEPYNKKSLIQAKRKGDGNKVSAPTVRKCSGLKHDNGVDEVLIVTTTSFTSQAREEADKYNVKLIGGKKLLELYQDNVES